MGNDENKKIEKLLTKDKTTELSLFDLIYQKYISILSKKSGEKKSKEESKELIPKTDEEETKSELDNNTKNNDDKFILLEEIKQTKQEDKTSTE